MGQMPETLHPLQFPIGSLTASSEVLHTVFTYMVVNDSRGEWVAMGVEQVPTIDSGGARFVGEGDDRHLQVTFRIREGLKWHDGTPTTSRDIAYAWELLMDPALPVSTREGPHKISAIDTPDDRTAVVKYMSANQAREAARVGFKGLPNELWESFQDIRGPLTDPFYFAAPTGSATPGWLPSHLLRNLPADRHETSDFARRPVGNGPYRLVEATDQAIEVQAISEHPLGAPATRSIVFRVMPNPDDQIRALQAGEVDIASQVQGPDIDRAPDLDRLQGYRTFYVPATPWEHIDLNTGDPLLQDRNVRKALIQGINRQEIVDKLMFGKTRVASSWIQPGLPAWAYEEGCVVPYRYDPAAAGRLLEQAGFQKGNDGVYARSGQPLRLKLQTTDAVLRQNVAQVVRASLRQVGIDLEIEALPGRGLFELQGPLVQGQFQLALYTWLASPDPDVSPLYSSVAVPSPENDFLGQNYPRYRNPQVDQLLARGANELSVSVRKQIYCEAVRLWTDDVPVIPLFQRLVVTVGRASLANLRPTPTQTPETWNAYAWFVPAP